MKLSFRVIKLQIYGIKSKSDKKNSETKSVSLFLSIIYRVNVSEAFADGKAEAGIGFVVFIIAFDEITAYATVNFAHPIVF